MQGFPVLPRYELNARLPERGTDLILKYEWRLSQGYYPTRKLPPTYIQKAPGSSPLG